MPAKNAPEVHKSAVKVYTNFFFYYRKGEQKEHSKVN